MNSLNFDVFMPFYVHENFEIVPALHHGRSFQCKNQKKKKKPNCVYCGEHAHSLLFMQNCFININTPFVNRLWN